ncbi:lipase family protein [Kosakonia sp.]|uniref:lipase family protein n=1 Tax=Kosakonia sp. TaxID=1916651 RepID=UPI00289EEBA8|nr:lipase family protein [Kosakonia sp.]
MTFAITSLKRKNPKAPTEKQLPYWVEIQLVDEQGDAVPDIPWKVESHHLYDGRIDQFVYAGRSDPNGLIRIDMPHGLELHLTLNADLLAKEMEKRTLRVGRDPGVDSFVRKSAEDNGYLWHYAVIGELCDMPPSIELRKGEVWPSFHFPSGHSFKGFTIRTNELEKRHVIEICPFRAWELVLHHQNEYCLANALNLGASASLAYADDNALDIISITQFYINQCQDLSRLPQLHKNGFRYNTLVQDVPFSERYYPPIFMDTARDTSISSENVGSGTSEKEVNKEITKADGDTQLYYVYNPNKVIIAWRGTASLYDVGTDLAFSPVNTQTYDTNKTQCTTLLSYGKVHDGFWSGYRRAEKKFSTEIEELIKLIKARELFICGHSLGGALALIHSAILKTEKPLLYTYGMPRTFTKSAIKQLSDIIHYRHVNDNDPVPAVPPEANLDNDLYKLWGPLGKALGMLWSMGEALFSPAGSWGDCFWHHGNPVVFLTATQSREWKECKIDLPIPAGCIALRRLLPIKVKLYLVPALASQEIQNAGLKQRKFKELLTQRNLKELFPEGNNHARGFDITFGDHFMTAYMPYMNNKLLELIDKEGLVKKRSFTEHIYDVDQFKMQMEENKREIPQTEYERNEIFFHIEDLLNLSLSTIFSKEQGNNILARFALYGEEAMENA